MLIIPSSWGFPTGPARHHKIRGLKLQDPDGELLCLSRGVHKDLGQHRREERLDSLLGKFRMAKSHKKGPFLQRSPNIGLSCAPTSYSKNIACQLLLVHDGLIHKVSVHTIAKLLTSLLL
jgi:hypothetical protein